MVFLPAFACGSTADAAEQVDFPTFNCQDNKMMFLLFHFRYKIIGCDGDGES